MAIDGPDTLDGRRAGIAGDGLLILGIRGRPRALGVMISRAAGTARAYLRDCLLPIDKTTRGLHFCRYARPKDRVRLSLHRSCWIFGAVLRRIRSSRDRCCSFGPFVQGPSLPVSLLHTPLRFLASIASKRSGRAMERQALEQALPSPLGPLTSFGQALGSVWLTDGSHWASGPETPSPSSHAMQRRQPTPRPAAMMV